MTTDGITEVLGKESTIMIFFSITYTEYPGFESDFRCEYMVTTI